MTAIDLLQQVGLNKYEAEAYTTLLAEGPLTGYELGKRSTVPLSRSYEVLERLARQGLALVQPGDPPRYLAEPWAQLVERTRRDMFSTVDALAAALARIAAPEPVEQFWVVRGRRQILSHARSRIATTRETVYLRAGVGAERELASELSEAEARGCRCIRSSGGATDEGRIMLLVDGREALAGMLSPPDRCQAVVGANQALVDAVRAYFARGAMALLPGATAAGPDVRRTTPVEWMAWDEQKQRRIRLDGGDNRVA